MVVQQIANASMSMGDENIRRIDYFLSMGDFEMVKILNYDGKGIVPAFTSYRLVWLNVKNNVRQVNKELHDDLTKLFDKLDGNINSKTNKWNTAETTELRKTFIELAEKIHESIDSIGIGIRILIKS